MIRRGKDFCEHVISRKTVRHLGGHEPNGGLLREEPGELGEDERCSILFLYTENIFLSFLVM